MNVHIAIMKQTFTNVQLNVHRTFTHDLFP